MTEILRGKPVAEELKENIKKRVEALKEKDKTPKLAVLRVGANPNDLSYEKGILKNCANLGIETVVVEKDEDIDTDSLMAAMQELNDDASVHGILMFRPLPKHIDEKVLLVVGYNLACCCYNFVTFDSSKFYRKTYSKSRKSYKKVTNLATDPVSNLCKR
jgi:5,10-methylene-tetrahydrofolate dehydrogenase/methenyl tetrahydrofolate cyclohydrolase